MSKITDIVLFSGGLDSTVLLYGVSDAEGAENVAALSFNYGQRHFSPESACATKIAQNLKVVREVVDISGIAKLLKSSLVNKNIEMPTAFESDKQFGNTIVVPSRNAIMLAIAHGWAYSIGAHRVWIGSHKGDYELFPDCRDAFFNSLNLTLRVGQEDEGAHKISLEHPFTQLTKEDLVEKGTKLSVPFAETWSCYDPVIDKYRQYIHCGKCHACRDRHKALATNGITKPSIPTRSE